MAAPEADPHGVVAAVPLATHHWPAAYAPGFSSTCFGCRPVALVGRKKREAHGGVLVPGVAGHPTGTSFVGRTVFGYPSLHHHGKREAEPEAHGLYHAYGYPYYGYGYGYGRRYGHYIGKRSAEPHGIAGHPGHATSYVGRTVFGYPSLHHYGKREAEPEAHGLYHAYGYPYYGYGYGYGRRYGHYIGKREAEAEPEPEAEPEADPHYGLYGYATYGYGYPYGYYHYGYPYAYGK